MAPLNAVIQPENTEGNNIFNTEVIEKEVKTSPKKIIAYSWAKVFPCIFSHPNKACKRYKMWIPIAVELYNQRSILANSPFFPLSPILVSFVTFQFTDCFFSRQSKWGFLTCQLKTALCQQFLSDSSLHRRNVTEACFAVCQGCVSEKCDH